MRDRYSLCSTLVALFVVAGRAQADVSATEFLNQALASQPRVVENRTKPVQKIWCHPTMSPLGGHLSRECDTETIQVKYQVSVPATVTNSRVIKATNIQLGQPTFTSVPIDSKGNYVRQLFNNCSSKTTLTGKYVFNASGTQGWTLVKTQGVQATQTTSVSLMIPLASLAALFSEVTPALNLAAGRPIMSPATFVEADGYSPRHGLKKAHLILVQAQPPGGGTNPSGGGGGITFGESWQQQVSTSTQVQNTSTSTASQSIEQDVSVIPSSAVLYQYIVYQATGSVPFTADVVVDGDVVANISGISTASQLLPSEQARTIKFSGILVLQTVSSGIVATSDTGGCSGKSAVLKPEMITALLKRTTPNRKSLMQIDIDGPSNETIIQTAACASEKQKTAPGIFSGTPAFPNQQDLAQAKFLRCLSAQ
jgi:hypothetical protein